MSRHVHSNRPLVFVFLIAFSIAVTALSGNDDTVLLYAERPLNGKPGRSVQVRKAVHEGKKTFILTHTLATEPPKTVELDSTRYKQMESELLSLILQRATFAEGLIPGCQPSVTIDLVELDEEAAICPDEARDLTAAKAILDSALTP